MCNCPGPKYLPCQTDASLAQPLQGCCWGTHKWCSCQAQWWHSVTPVNSRTGLHWSTSFTNSCYACADFLLSPSSHPSMQPKASAGHAGMLCLPLAPPHAGADSASLGCQAGRPQPCAMLINRALSGCLGHGLTNHQNLHERLMKPWRYMAKGEEFTTAAANSAKW